MFIITADRNYSLLSNATTIFFKFCLLGYFTALPRYKAVLPVTLHSDDLTTGKRIAFEINVEKLSHERSISLISGNGRSPQSVIVSDLLLLCIVEVPDSILKVTVSIRL
jgi:hypothetical protein